MTELRYDQLTPEQQETADKGTLLETETNLYLVDELGRITGYRCAEMFANGTPKKWSSVLALGTGEPIQVKGGAPMSRAAREKIELAAAVIGHELKAAVNTLGVAGLIRWVKLSLIDRCPFQPRKTFDRTRLDELKTSIGAHGFVAEMSHFWVRPHPVHPGRFELIDGERRQIVTGELIAEDKYFALEGGKRMPVEDGLVPITVSSLTDAQVLEYALVNAMQREELSVIEEAEAICKLLEIPKADGEMPGAAEVAGHLGCTESHVKRCKLLRRLRDTATGAALEAGHLSKAHAEVLARVADEKKRDELTRRVVKPSDGRGLMPVSVLEEWIDKEVQISLGSANFDRSDADLVPLKTAPDGESKCGGACGEPLNDRGNPTAVATAKIWNWTCPFVETPRGLPMCMNPDCFRAKQNASYEVWRKTTEAGGANIVTMSAEESDGLWDHTGKRLTPNCGYVEIEARPEEWYVKAGTPPLLTWKKMLRGTACPILAVKDRHGAVHELAKRDQAKRIATEIGHDIFRGTAGAEPATPAGIAAADDGDPRIASAAAGVQRDAAREARQAEQAGRDAAAKREGVLAERTMLALKRGVMEGSRGMKRLAPEFWHLILGPLVDLVKEQGYLGDLCEVLGKAEHLTNPVDNEDWLDRIVRGTPVEQMPSLVIVAAREMLSPGETEVWMKLACKTFGVDAKAVRKRVVTELEAEERAEAERLEIENGVRWSLPLKEKADELEWLSDGDCANANLASLALPQTKGERWVALLGVARTHKGWHAGHALSRGKKPLAHSMPNMNSASYSNAALASATALRAVHQAMVDASGPEPMQTRVSAYIAAVKLPAEKSAKAAKAKKKGAGFSTAAKGCA